MSEQEIDIIQDLPETDMAQDVQESEATPTPKREYMTKARLERKRLDKARFDARQRDIEIFAETAKLQDSAKQVYSNRHINHKQPELDSALEFIWYGEQVLRSIGWHLKYPHYSLQDPLYDEEVRKEIHEKEYMLCIPDAACYSVVEVAHYDIHLTPELSAFGIKVYEKFLSWAKNSDEFGLDFMPEIRAELAARKNGEDTFTVRKPPKGKPGPKPRVPDYPDEKLFQPARLIVAATVAEVIPEVEPEPEPELTENEILSPGQLLLTQTATDIRRRYVGLNSDATKYLENGS